MTIHIETMGGFKLDNEDREALCEAAEAAIKEGRDINDAFDAVDTSAWHDPSALFENVTIYTA